MNRTMPKSYLTDAERAELRSEGASEENIYLEESIAAGRAKDDEAAWAWLALCQLPPVALKMLKELDGSQFIRDMGFDTTLADAEYGAGWLDHS